MLVGEFRFPVPQDFLSSVYSPAPEVTHYLVEEQGFDLYAKNENQKRDDDDGTCSYFSEANIERLRSAVRNYRSIHGIRAQDYRVIGETLSKLAEVLITDVSGTRVGEAPIFKCASADDANKLAKFLEICGKHSYTAMPMNNEVWSHNAYVCADDFIRIIGKAAGVFEESQEKQNTTPIRSMV